MNVADMAARINAADAARQEAAETGRRAFRADVTCSTDDTFVRFIVADDDVEACRTLIATHPGALRIAVEPLA